MPEVISLGVGEPDFITPWRIREKGITALEEGLTTYTSNKGLFVLRREISQHLKKKYSLRYHCDEEVLITVGVSQGMDLALRTIIEKGDKIIVVSPHYVAYPALIEINGGKPLYLVTKEEENFKINPTKLKQLLEKNPKAIILNYPCNPTGITYSHQELREIWGVLSSKETIIISDEIYDELAYDTGHIPFSSLSKRTKKRTVLLNGFSKGYAMTGFRVGFACADKEIISGMAKIHSFLMLCAPILSQLAAVEGLAAKEEVKEMRKEYQRRRDFIVKELNTIGLRTVNPQGAFYCLSSLKGFKRNSLEFAQKLLLQEKVAVVPGGAFGKEYDSYIRISYANTIDNLKEAIMRIERFLKETQ
ncbi:MAG: pyridoxal phosphate-dependent aminotransferase [Nitrospinota bacterium]